MSIELTVRQIEGVIIFDISGRMVSGNDGRTLHAALMHEFEHGHRWMLLNCGGLQFVDSSGLGDLVAAYAAVVHRGGVARIVNPSRALADLLARTRLNALLDVYDDEGAALESFTELNNQRTQEKLAGYLQRDQ